MMNEFDEIRPYHDEELPQVFEELIADPMFQQVMKAVMPSIPFEAIAQKMRSCQTKLEFQKAFCYTFLQGIIQKSTLGVTLNHDALTDKQTAYTYISNHRDIILDSGFLDMLLVGINLDTVEIAIGDNLLIYPWIKKLVRINKSFIVQRALSMRQMLESSARMARYMHYCINEKGQSIWIAQREGRAKDSNDRTQESIVKMIAMGGEGTILDRIKQQHIVPLSISYEFDPCDYLKAKEFQQKRDLPEFKKSQADDLLNMQTGLFGYKGHVHFQPAACINNELEKLDTNTPKAALFAKVTQLIDHGIHANYRIFANNYVALDLLNNNHAYQSHYSEEEKQQFLTYLETQMGRIDLPNKDEAFLRHKMLEMYANPLINHLATQQA